MLCAWRVETRPPGLVLGRVREEASISDGRGEEGSCTAHTRKYCVVFPSLIPQFSENTGIQRSVCQTGGVIGLFGVNLIVTMHVNCSERWFHFCPRLTHCFVLTGIPLAAYRGTISVYIAVRFRHQPRPGRERPSTFINGEFRLKLYVEAASVESFIYLHKQK